VRHCWTSVVGAAALIRQSGDIIRTVWRWNALCVKKKSQCSLEVLRSLTNLLVR